MSGQPLGTFIAKGALAIDDEQGQLSRKDLTSDVFDIRRHALILSQFELKVSVVEKKSLALARGEQGIWLFVDRNLRKSYEFARQITKKHAKSFYFSSFPLPENKRLRAYAIYAYCRYCDDRIDRAPPGNQGEISEDLKKLTKELLSGGKRQRLPEWGAAFCDTCIRCHVPLELFYELIYGVCLDASGNVRIPDWPKLREYCYYVASVVGLLMNHVFEPADSELARAPAIALGIAMQLTNILRDVREDALMGRIYLPSDELADYGLTGVDFSSAEAYRTDNWRQYAAFFAERARNHYLAAEPGIWLLPDDGSRYCVLCMSRIYGAILDKIQEANWDVSSRRYVPFWDKAFIALMALNQVRKERANDNT